MYYIYVYTVYRNGLGAQNIMSDEVHFPFLSLLAFKLISYLTL